MTLQDNTETLVESFCALADEVQSLIDRKTILEHKLRFAAEQYQHLADKYAPEAPEISETLAQLQLPADLHRPAVPSANVPLPKRGPVGCNQHQIALLIRDGRRAAQELAASRAVKEESSSGSSGSAPSTVMEQDFTVEGKKGMLECPFSVKRELQLQRQKEELQLEQQERQRRRSSVHREGSLISRPDAVAHSDPTPQHADPICIAMQEDAKSQAAPSSAGAAKCPIRYLDQHSPEEIAHYVETHKHELPRSHAICLRRYNKTEEQVRKLDAKYGSLVNMISGLGQLHQPMLPAPGTEGAAEQDRAEVHRSSNERVEDWAQAVSGSVVERQSGDVLEPSYERRSRRDSNVDSGAAGDDTDMERESHFDRPLKEVRLGESPSRPWGIAVPLSSLPNADTEPPLSPPAAPVRMPSPRRCPVAHDTAAAQQPRKCPFDHTKFAGGASPFPNPHEQEGGPIAEAEQPQTPTKSRMPNVPQMPPPMPSHAPTQATQVPFMQQMPQAAQTQMPSTTSYQAAPAFVNFTPPTTATKTDGTVPQMLFTGPVFIGYSMEQAIQFMQHFQSMQK